MAGKQGDQMMARRKRLVASSKKAGAFGNTPTLRKFSICLPLAAFLLTGQQTRAEAQEPKKIPRLGYLSAGTAPMERDRLAIFQQGLRELGYVETKNILIEYRFAEGKLERLPELAAELARLNIDIIVTGGNEAVQSAKNTTQTIPIVMAFSGDPVGAGFVDSLARPGGNITGLSRLNIELSKAA